MSVEDGLNQDFLDILAVLGDSDVEFLVVGAHAMALHGVPRATGDLDILVRPSAENAERVISALRAFGAPIDAHSVTREDFEIPGQVYQIGLPPRRIDLLTSISGIGFDGAWDSRFEVELQGRKVPFLSREALIQNKQASGREKDLVDVKLLSGD